MSEKEAKEMLYTLVANNCRGNDEYLGSYEQAFDIIIDLLEQKDNRIYELEKALIDEDFKYRNRIKELNNRINQAKKYIENIMSTCNGANLGDLQMLLNILEE